MGQCFFFFSLMMSFSLSWAQGSPRRDPAAFARVPQELNEKAVLKCLPRMKGFLTSRENTDLDALKTKIELVFGMQKPLIEYRELVYKNQADETWKVEFHLFYGSRWGKEQYLVKFFKTSGGVGFVEAPSPLKDTLLNKDAALRFAQHEQIERAD